MPTDNTPRPGLAAGSRWARRLNGPPGWGVPVVGLTVAAIGGIYFVLWVVGVGARLSAAGVLTMKTNMALSLTLLGVALVLVDPRRTTPTRRAIGMVLAAVVIAVASLTLAEHAFGLDFGIDQLLATEAPGAVATARPNRFGLPGGVSLMLVGAGVVAVAMRRRVASYFALAVGIVALVPAVGFVAGIVTLYGDAVTGIAWLTVLAFVLLATGLHLAEGQEGPFGMVWRDDAGGRLLRQVLPPAVLAPLVLQLLMRLGERIGLYGHAVGVGLLLISSVLAISALLWRGAHRLTAEARRAQGLEAQARWRAELLELVQDAILVWSPSTGIDEWNEGAEGLYGYTSSEALGRSPHDLLQTEAAQPLVRIEAEVQRVGRWEGELRHRAKDGHAVVVSSKLRLVRGPDGRERVLEVNRDLRVQKKIEEDLREASREKDEFLNLLSHELRNPLAPIANSLFILEHAEPTGQQARRAKEIIGRQVGHLTRLVDDLLEVTRITRRKVQLRRAHLDLGELARRIGEDHREVLKGRGLDFAVDTPGQEVWVDGDETRLTQVIGNLLHNAAKFTSPGGKVALSVVPLDGAAEVRVRDSGAGIAPALLGRLFEPFVQAEQTLARTEGGLGLGLALVKGLVELHGGTVQARSGGVGLGAEFVVRLPTVAPPASERPSTVTVHEQQRPLRVLVVDDSVDAADTLAELVKILGHAAEVAYDGPSAIAKASASVPDVVLCDLGLPQVNGYDVARALRANPALHSTRLVAVSGYAAPEDVQRAMEAGFMGHIAKPPDLMALERYLGQAPPG